MRIPADPMDPTENVYDVIWIRLGLPDEELFGSICNCSAYVDRDI